MKDCDHDDLVSIAKKWLARQSCGVVLGEPFRARTSSQEIPDAIGWRGCGTSILIECKTSRQDFLADARKPFRVNPELGMGNWRFYLSPPGIIQVDDLPVGWGLLWTKDSSSVARAVHGVPGNCYWRSRRPFLANREAESELLMQAMRRLVIRGHLEDVYDPLPHSRKSFRHSHGERSEGK